MKTRVFRGMGLYWLVFIFALGIIGYEFGPWRFPHKESELEQFISQKVTIQGVLVEEQEKRDYNTRVKVQIKEINKKEIFEKQKVLVTTTSPKDFYYGDLVTIRGQLTRPENFYTDTGREFDYVGYLESNNIEYLLKNASVQVHGNEPPSSILAGLFWLKREFVDSLKKMLPEPKSSLAAGILIDGKQSINGELQEKFRKTGLVHIVVLSGYNVSIVAEAIGKVFSFLPRFLGISFSMVGIVLFALITGASATVVRSSIMAILVLLSRLSIRKYDPTRGLFLASLLMLIQNPSILIHSPSFQLSFLATFTVVKVVPWVEQFSFTRFIPEKFGLREIVISNVTVQLYLLPILTWMTGFVSAVSLPVNILILPLMPLTMLSCFITGLTGFLPYMIALPFAFVSNGLLSYELAIVNYFSQFSLSEISFNIFSTNIVIGFYAITIVAFLLIRGTLKEDRGNKHN
ncbi:MAG TPA: ComEC/Rec2 family competence protein [Candidatus Nanoarchaeia archaeon]|nr:ComEC/Rec2 family competence protein [Candidatus Nanoarchaeia archaeon]